MNTYVYGIIHETYCYDSIERVSYGIVCYENAQIDGIVSVAATIHDITSDYDSLNRLVELCNRLSLSPLHLHDVVEDYLSAD